MRPLTVLTLLAVFFVCSSAGGDAKPGEPNWAERERFLADHADAIAKLRDAASHAKLGFVASAAHADFTDKDRIALPGIKTSIQAVTLQMACEQVFGKGQGGKLDSITVSMGHPDAQAAMLGGHSEIDAHFGSAPFMYDELADPRVHKVLDSFQVVGGPHTFNTVWANSKFANGNPKIMKAFLDALEESMTRIKADPATAGIPVIALTAHAMAEDRASTTNSTTLFRRRFFDMTDPPDTPRHTSTHVSAAAEESDEERN